MDRKNCGVGIAQVHAYSKRDGENTLLGIRSVVGALKHVKFSVFSINST